MSLPPEILRVICKCLVQDENPSNRAILLTSFCGVCQRWREYGRETTEPLALDGCSDTQHGPKATVLRFRRTTLAKKRALFVGASRLLTGYSDITLSGEAVDDQVLLNVAVTNGPALASVRLVSAPNVTDAGLCTLISAAPNLKQFSLEDVGRGVVGHFVPTLLQHCKQLETLFVEGAEAMNWAALRLSGAWAAALAAAAPEAYADPTHGSTGSNSSGQCLERMPPTTPASAQAAGAASGAAGATASNLLQLQQGSSLDVAGASSSRGQPLQQQQQQQQPSRVSDGGAASSSYHPADSSSSSSDSSNVTFNSCQEELLSDDASSDSTTSHPDAGSSSTSISMPPQAVEVLTQQLQHILAGQEPPAAAAAATSRRQAHSQQPPRSRHTAVRPCHVALRRLRVRSANVDTLQQLLECVPGLSELQLDGPALSVQAAALLCPALRRLSYLVSSPGELDAALLCMSSMRNLRALELEVKGMVLSTEQLRVIGMLPLRELALDSHAYRQHPSMPRPQYSHLDNEGVKGLVDSICSRMRTELMPLKLSLCGATALKQEAVSALLRLPILASIDTGGCVKLTPMDRMRLVAKVKAGQGLMDRTAAAGAAGSSGAAAAAAAAGGLRLQHHVL